MKELLTYFFAWGSVITITWLTQHVRIMSLTWVLLTEEGYQWGRILTRWQSKGTTHCFWSMDVVVHIYKNLILLSPLFSCNLVILIIFGIRIRYSNQQFNNNLLICTWTSVLLQEFRCNVCTCRNKSVYFDHFKSAFCPSLKLSCRMTNSFLKNTNIPCSLPAQKAVLDGSNYPHM